MSIADEAKVRNGLADFNARIYAVIQAGWNDFMSGPNNGRYLYARSRAAEVSDHIARHALMEFGNDADIRTINKDQTVKLLFKGTVLARFKKANSVGLGANVMTQAVMQFIDPQLSFPGLLDDIHKIEICYVLDDLKTGIKAITVVARAKNRKLWSYELPVAMPSATVVTFPTPAPTPGQSQPPEVRVRKLPSRNPDRK